jgi:sortase A
MNTDDKPIAQGNNPPEDPAVNIIRSKLHKLYDEEPDAKEEIKEVGALPKKDLSKHQRYMKGLSESGKSLAEIQTAWHEYYTNLPDGEKHEVWKEFYSQHERLKHKSREDAKKREEVTQKPSTTTVISLPNQPAASRHDPRGGSDIRQQILQQIKTRASIEDKSHHVKSLIFGVGMGSLVVIILLFSFFNERFVTPFIRPSHNVSSTPIIVDPIATGPVSPESKIIIPKINVEAPVVFDEESVEEKAIQGALERGVVHYATTPDPGEKGNSVIVGHSSSNILNKGKYKFAFLLLKSLEEGDTFIVQKDGKRYVYKVYKEFVTSPTDVSVLGPTDKPATITLVTCDPPGTSTNRLIIVGEQIFPDPGSNKESTIVASQTKPNVVPGNAPSLWQRLRDTF